MSNRGVSQQTSNDTRELNRIWWDRQVRAELENFALSYANKSLEESSQQFQSLAGCAGWYTDFVFVFLTSGHEEEAQQAAGYAILAAQEALRIESFDPMFIPEVRDTSPYREIEKLNGQSSALKCLHYARWFSTGERPLELLQQSADYHQQYYDLQIVGIQRYLLAYLMMDYVEGEQFGKALDVFHRGYRGKTDQPRDARFSRSTERTLAAVSEYALGDEEYKLVTQKAVEHWYKKVTMWSTIDFSLPWGTRLSWAWLRGRHFTGVTELRPLLYELRGF